MGAAVVPCKVNTCQTMPADYMQVSYHVVYSTEVL